MGISKAEIAALLKKQNPLILEIGAHEREDTVQFLSEFKDIKIYCFEPDPRCIEVFNKKINDSRCTLINAAVSRNDGKTTLNISGGWPIAVPRLIKLVGLNMLFERAVLFLRKGFNKKYEFTGASSIVKSISKSKD